MIKAIAKILVLTMVLASVTACSNQWYEVNPGATEDEILDTMDRIQSQGGGVQAFDAALMSDLTQDSSKSVYFLKSGSSGLLPEAVMSLSDASPFVSLPTNATNSSVFALGLSEVSVVFLDAVGSDGQRYFALMIEAKLGDSSTYYVGISNPQDYVFTDSEFALYLPGLNGQTVVLRTFDVDPDFSETLGANIRFRAYSLNANGQEVPIGQFAALAGFGG